MCGEVISPLKSTLTAKLLRHFGRDLNKLTSGWIKGATTFLTPELAVD